jgi:hypothetical protein
MSETTTATAARTFNQRIGYLITCVIPAELLSADPIDKADASSLRADASQDGLLSYAQVRYMLEDGAYVARVAASPTQVAQGYTVLLTEQQLYFALPWDVRLEWSDHLQTQKRSPESILTLLHASAAEAQPIKKLQTPEQTEAATPTPTIASLTPLDTVEVSNEDVQDAIALVTKQGKSVDPKQLRHISQFHLQQALLTAMIDALMTQLYHTQEHAQALTLKARCALIAQIQRWHRSADQERLVNATPRFSQERQQVVWRLTVGMPVAA